MTINPCDKRGFTLIEVMVTLLIMAFGLLASIIGIMSALDHSLMNEMRNDAMKLAQEQAEAARDLPYANLLTLSSIYPQTIWRQVRKTPVPYTVKFTSPAIAGAGTTTGMTLVQFQVQWKFKNTTYSYVLQTIVRQTK